MNDMVVDSSVVAKWILPEADSSKAQQLISDAGSRGERLTLLDLAFAEVSNAIWKRHHRGLATIEDARKFLEALLRMPVSAEPAFPLLDPALEIAMKYHRPVYDTLFVALTEKLGSSGVTADETSLQCGEGRLCPNHSASQHVDLSELAKFEARS